MSATCRRHDTECRRLGKKTTRRHPTCGAKYTEHIANLDPSLIDAIDAQVEKFEQFCWGTQNGKLTTGTIFTPEADDIELMNFSKKYHVDRNENSSVGTTPGAGATTTTPGAGGGGTSKSASQSLPKP